MKTHIDETLELLSENYKLQDMWDEINNERTKNVIIRFLPGTRYKLRLLGPFIQARRIYLPTITRYQFDFLNMADIKKILNGNHEVAINKLEKIKQEKNKLESKSKKEPKAPDVMGFNSGGLPPPQPGAGYYSSSLNRFTAPLNTKEQQQKQLDDLVSLMQRLCNCNVWQKCVLVNAFIISSSKIQSSSKIHRLGILPVVNKMMNNMQLSQTKVISGINAHDIMILREGMGLDTKYNMSLSNEVSCLSDAAIKYILKHGLYDIPKTLKQHNKIAILKSKNHIYKTNDKYIMENKLTETLRKSFVTLEEKKDLETCERNLDEIPDEAFENSEHLTDTINSLEL